MAGSEVPAIDGPAGQGRNQGAAHGAVVVLRSGRACDRGEGSGADRRAKRPAGQPRASSLAAFEPSLHFVDVIHALDDDAAGRGGEFVLEGAEAGADVDAPFDGSLDGLRVHVVLRGGVGGERRRLAPGRHPPPRFRPASSSRRRGTHARRSSPSVPVTEAGRRRPRSPPRRCHWCEGGAELVRRHRGHASHLGGPGAGGDGVVPAADGFVYVDRAEPATHCRMWRCGWTVPAARRCRTAAPRGRHTSSRGAGGGRYAGARGGAYSPPFAVRYAAPADTVPGGCDGRDTGAGADSRSLSRSPVRSNR